MRRVSSPSRERSVPTTVIVGAVPKQSRDAVDVVAEGWRTMMIVVDGEFIGRQTAPSGAGKNQSSPTHTIEPVALRAYEVADAHTYASSPGHCGPLTTR